MHFTVYPCPSNSAGAAARVQAGRDAERKRQSTYEAVGHHDTFCSDASRPEDHPRTVSAILRLRSSEQV
jgi:hypothetical protein